MKVIVAGCGRVGTQLAEMMSMDGHQVVVIDSNPHSFDRLSKLYAGGLVEGKAFDEETLIEAGINGADAFTSLTNFDNTNLMAAEVATHIFKVPRVVSRLYNPDKETTYQALGIDYVCGTVLVAETIMEKLVSPKLIVRAKFANNRFLLVEFNTPRKWYGRSIYRLQNDEGLGIAFIVREGGLFIPNGDAVLSAGDEVCAVLRDTRARRLERLLRK